MRPNYSTAYNKVKIEPHEDYDVLVFMPEVVETPPPVKKESVPDFLPEHLKSFYRDIQKTITFGTLVPYEK